MQGDQARCVYSGMHRHTGSREEFSGVRHQVLSAPPLWELLAELTSAAEPSLVEAFAFPKVRTRTAAELLERVVAERGGLVDRAHLLGYYTALDNPSDVDRENRVKHLRFLVSERPDEAFLAMWLDPSDEKHLRVAEEWRAQARRHRDSPGVLANAATFLSDWDFTEATTLFRQVVALEPREWRWRLRFARVLLKRADRDRDNAEALARQAGIELDEALALALATDHALLYDARAEAALMCDDLVTAIRNAKSALEAAAKQPEWFQGNLLHIGHTVLGAVAFDSGDWDRALDHLESSLLVPESPQFDVRGPSKRLLRRLLRAGQQDVVDGYLDRWRARFGLPKDWAIEDPLLVETG